MQIEKSVIDAQSFMQDKEKRQHEMLQVKRESSMNVEKRVSDERVIKRHQVKWR